MAFHLFEKLPAMTVNCGAMRFAFATATGATATSGLADGMTTGSTFLVTGVGATSGVTTVGVTTVGLASGAGVATITGAFLATNTGLATSLLLVVPANRPSGRRNKLAG